MYWALVVPCALLACAYALCLLHGRRARRMFAHLPGYPELPFIGNLHQVLDCMGAIIYTAKISEETMLPFRIWVGPRPAIVVSDPEDVKAVTNAFVDKPYYYNFARDFVGNGLVTAPSHIWRRSIKKLAGTFTGNIVSGYQGVFNAQAASLVDKLRGEVGGEPFNILHKYLAYTTLETICQTALGVPWISKSIVTEEYYTAFNRTFELFVQRGMNLLLHPDWVYRLTPLHKELMQNIAVLHNVSATVLSKRMKERAEMNLNGRLTVPVENTENGKSKFKAFLDILLDLKEEDPTLTQEQIKSEVDTIIVGGQETVATTLFFTLLMVGCRPNVQDKLYAEIKTIFGDSKRPVEREDLARMQYCDAVLNETLRMYPPVPIIMRDADRDLQIKSCTIPKGTGCGVNVWAAGRSRRVWGPDAEVYRPERWLEEELATFSASFLAFSYGKRACIGKRYAMAIMKTVLTYVIRELEVISEADKLQLKCDIVLKATSGQLIQVKLRQ